MRHLIIYVHPDKGSLNHHLMQTVVEALQSNHHEIEIRDLYQLGLNPVLSLHDLKKQRMGIVEDDVKQEQEYITWADHIIFIYPIWWTGMPAMMKGYIDRVFSYGFAYRYDEGIQKGLLTGKQATIINTQGKSKTEYQNLGMDKALLLTSDTGVFTYCGLEIYQHLFFDRSDKANLEIIEKWSSQLKTVLKNIRT